MNQTSPSIKNRLVAIQHLSQESDLMIEEFDFEGELQSDQRTELIAFLSVLEDKIHGAAKQVRIIRSLLLESWKESWKKESSD